MALQTRIEKITLTSYASDNSEVFRTLLNKIPFEFDPYSEIGYFIKKTGYSDDSMVGLSCVNTTNLHLTMIQSSGQVRNQNVSSLFVSGAKLLSFAWDDDFITIFQTHDPVLPDASVRNRSNTPILGWYLCKAADPDGKETWVAGTVWTESTATSGVAYGFNHLCYDDFIDDYTTTQTAEHLAGNTNYRTGSIITAPCIGRGKCIPTDKLSIITGTPEPYIGSVGWVDIGGREYYKNGIFLIDAQKSK